MTRKLVLTRGAPASGKSTWARQWVAEAPESRLRVNRDDLRRSLFNATGGTTTRSQEDLVTRFQHEQIALALRNQFDVVSDDTNLTAKFVKELVKIGRKLNAEIVFEDSFLDVPLSTLLARDRSRTDSVGEDVIRRFHSRLGHVKGSRPGMDDSVSAAPTFELWEPTPGLPSAILVDIDGTLAHNNGKRSFFDETLVGGDDPDPIVVQHVRDTIELGRHQVIFMSGRTAGCRAETLIWLEQHVLNGVDPAKWYAPKLFMRRVGDSRNDAIVKNELFNEHINGKFNVQYCLDDRNRVVDMWRAKNLKVFQVQDGAF